MDYTSRKYEARKVENEKLSKILEAGKGGTFSINIIYYKEVI
jgi:hypothetical protein